MSKAHLPTLTLGSLQQRTLAPLVLLVVFVSQGFAGQSFNIENTNFLLRQPDRYNTKEYVYDYDRLRLTGQWRDGNAFVTAIGDAVNFLGHGFIHSPDFEYADDLRPDIPFEVRTEAQHYGPGAAYARIHRLYGGYDDGVRRLGVGIQKISMGVGRIWTPTDLYNPKNSYALEPDEVYGVLAANFAYALTDLSVVNAVVSVRKDRSLKYAARYKGYLEFADVGIDLIKSDDTVMVGYELEGNFFDTGAEWRSEGGYYKNDPLDAEFFQGIAGFDYGFENGITWAVEALYSSETFNFEQLVDAYENEITGNMVQSHFYAGTTLTYDFDLAYSGSLLYIESFNEQNSRFVAPTLTYTFNDHHVFSAGALLGEGGGRSEFGRYGRSFYIKWALSY
jgi:hypothetical protein